MEKLTPEQALINSVEVKNIDKATAEYRHKNGFRGWHCHKSYTLNNSSVSITDSIGGCGMQQIYGWYDGNYNREDIRCCLYRLMQDVHNGVSCIICQVGNVGYNTVLTETLEELGFEITKEYVNRQHRNDDTQRLYTLIIEPNAPYKNNDEDDCDYDEDDDDMDF